ncbi:FAD-binding oxidoreductase [Streptomyces sp. WMMB 322]|uniref:FAD-binding oxidoreductase n=1 Tax=Streptomyces sp. WMMB 322 TaxID=1286821 RepID=UPI0006E2584C|nr:FAD-binding oxidoreductase [Streptomyces sp. WMMB 322]SCK18840.1 FAD/FMN-containing dehydrogenase [Streptomyces sp. WMMB 322]
MSIFTGPVFRAGDAGYDAERAGLNRAVEHRPACVVGAVCAEDAAAAVRAATSAPGGAVGVLATGHGPSAGADGDAVLVNTRRMTGVRVDPVGRTAWIEAGARWRDVLAASTCHGLAPLNGSSPSVGAVGYTLGGGAGLLGRRYGYAADHVRRLDVATADGRLRRVTGDGDPDLFWALRGGKDNFGIVVAMEIGLFPVARLYGGGLYFPAEATAEVLHAYAAWTRTAPEEMASSVLLMRYPDLPGAPEPLRGRFVTHVRIAYSGAPADGERLVRPLRGLGPRLLDTVRDMPYVHVGSIHHEPTDAPYVAYDRNLLLRELDVGAVETLVATAGPDADAPYVVEVRHFGGAYARSPAAPNAVGGRDAAFSLFTGVDAGAENRASRDCLHRKMAPWGTGGSCANFLGVEDTAPEALRSAYTAGDYATLRAVKAAYDPDNVFRVNHNIPPADN